MYECLKERNVMQSKQSDSIPSYYETILDSIQLDYGMRQHDWERQRREQKNAIAEKVVNLIVDKIRDKKYKIEKDGLGNDIMLVHIRHKTLKSMVGTIQYDVDTLKQLIHCNSDTKRLTDVFKKVGKNYTFQECIRRQHGGSSVDGETVVTILWFLLGMFPSYVYLFWISECKRKGDTFVIENL